MAPYGNNIELTPTQIYRSQHIERPRRNGGRKGIATGETETREGRPHHAETAERGRQIRRDRLLQISPDASSDPNWNRVASKEDSMKLPEN